MLSLSDTGSTHWPLSRSSKAGVVENTLDNPRYSDSKYPEPILQLHSFETNKQHLSDYQLIKQITFHDLGVAILIAYRYRSSTVEQPSSS